MKLFRIFTAVVLAVMLALPCAMASTDITASATGEVMVTADTAVITLGVSTRNSDVLAGQALVNSTIANIRLALTSAGVPEEDINTGSISIYAVYDYYGEVERVSSYAVSSLLAIRTTDIANVGMLIDTAFEAGANSLNDITFSASDTSIASTEALQAAVAGALAKADVIASAAGMQVTGITSIQESHSYSYDSGVNNFAYAKAEAARADGATVVQAAKLCVTASVTVTCTAE